MYQYSAHKASEALSGLGYRKNTPPSKGGRGRLRQSIGVYPNHIPGKNSSIRRCTVFPNDIQSCATPMDSRTSPKSRVAP